MKKLKLSAAVDEDSFAAFISHIEADGVYTIAQINGGSASENIQIAKLFAAAPEMRAALSEVFKMLEEVRTGKIERGVNLYLADAQAVILDAITKAEGKS